MSDLISRQTVLRCIKESRDNIDWGQSEDGDAFLHYIGALYRTIASEECLPSVEHHKLNIAEYIHDFYPDVWRHAEKELEVTSAQRKAEWIEDGYQDYPCVCSYCGSRQDIKAKFLFSYCPNCGARMGEKT